MKKTLSVKKQNFYSNVIVGICFIITGIVHSIPIEIFDKMGTFLSVILIIILSYTLFSKKEREDEMTKLNMGASFRTAFKVMVITLLLFEIIDLLVKYYFNVQLLNPGSVLQIPIGIGYLTVGLCFAKLDGGIFDADTED